MAARKTYSAAEVEQIGVPAYHPKGFWYDPVAPKSRELGFFFGPATPRSAGAGIRCRPSCPKRAGATNSDCWCELCRK